MNYRSSHNIILKAFLKNNHIIPGQWLISKLSRFTRKVTSRWLRILCLYLLNKCHFTHQKIITSESLFFMWYCRALFFSYYAFIHGYYFLKNTGRTYIDRVWLKHTNQKIFQPIIPSIFYLLLTLPMTTLVKL